MYSYTQLALSMLCYRRLYMIRSSLGCMCRCIMVYTYRNQACEIKDKSRLGARTVNDPFEFPATVDFTDLQTAVWLHVHCQCAVFHTGGAWDLPTARVSPSSV